MSDPDFTTLVDRFLQYFTAASAANTLSRSSDLALEALERLRQLDFLFRRVRHLDDEIARLQPEINRRMRSPTVPARRVGAEWTAWLETPEAAAIRDMSTRQNEFAFELKLMSETFYYFAFRLRCILRSTSHPLPGLRSFECPGVRDVRNHLLQHPESASSGFLQQAWSYGSPEGVRLKPYRDPRRNDQCIDAGFYENAREFRENLDRVLGAALSAPFTAA